MGALWGADASKEEDGRSEAMIQTAAALLTRTAAALQLLLSIIDDASPLPPSWRATASGQLLRPQPTGRGGVVGVVGGA